MKKYLLTGNIRLNGTSHKTGATVEVDDKVAAELIASGLLQPAAEPKHLASVIDVAPVDASPPATPAEVNTQPEPDTPAAETSPVDAAPVSKKSTKK